MKKVNFKMSLTEILETLGYTHISARCYQSRVSQTPTKEGVYHYKSQNSVYSHDIFYKGDYIGRMTATECTEWLRRTGQLKF